MSDNIEYEEMNEDEHHTPVMPAVPIPAGYCGACARSGVGACDDFPNCPAGIKVTEGN